MVLVDNILISAISIKVRLRLEPQTNFFFELGKVVVDLTP